MKKGVWLVDPESRRHYPVAHWYGFLDGDANVNEVSACNHRKSRELLEAYIDVALFENYPPAYETIDRPFNPRRCGNCLKTLNRVAVGGQPDFSEGWLRRNFADFGGRSGNELVERSDCHYWRVWSSTKGLLYRLCEMRYQTAAAEPYWEPATGNGPDACHACAILIGAERIDGMSADEAELYEGEISAEVFACRVEAQGGHVAVCNGCGRDFARSPGGKSLFCFDCQHTLAAQLKARPPLIETGEEKMVRIFDVSDSDERFEVVILTDCDDERQFTGQLARAMSNELEAQPAAFLEQILSRSTDVVCKYRGYKSEVHERRLLLAGEVWPAEDVAPLAGADMVERAEPVEEKAKA